MNSSRSVVDISEGRQEESVSLLCNVDYGTMSGPEEHENCGWLHYRPHWLQRLRTPAWALVFISSAAFLQGVIVNGILHFIIPTIERRFNLRSLKSGLVSGSYDIASLFCLIPVTYIGGRQSSSKPFWIGSGVILLGVGSLIFASPYFLASRNGEALNNESGKNLCNGDTDRQACENNEETQLSNFMWVFLIGNLFHGAGSSPLYTLGVTYIDESVVKRKTGIYIGIYYTGATLGVAVGYIVAGYFLLLHEDFLSDTGTNLSPNNKTWIGAWWLGFVIFGLICLVVAIPILALPAHLPGWEQVKLSKLSEAIVRPDQPKSYDKLKELPSAMINLFKNTSFVLLNFAGCCEGLIFSGSGAFMPKIIQYQFQLSHKTTAFVMGVITVPSCILGTMLGGGILKRFDLRFVGILKLCMTTASLSMICSTCFLVTCSGEKMVGLNVPYYTDRKTVKLEDPCNEVCKCSEKEFIPICGINNYTYYSPCYAGCRKEHSTEGDTVLYSNCSCIDEQGNDGVQASSQSCKITCSLLPIFLIFMYLSLFFTFIAIMPALTATLRCVSPEQRSLALGVQWMLVRLLGMIPGPMIFGLIIDGTCMYWHASCSKEEGSCILYDHYMISRSIVMLSYGWKSLEIVLFGLSLYFYKKDSQSTR